MELLYNICELDNRLRRVFLEELTKVQKETSKSIDRNALKRIDKGELFEDINVWGRAYNRYSNVLKKEKKKIEELNENLTSGKVIRWKDLVGFFGFLLGYHEYVVHPAKSSNLFDGGNSGSFFYRNVSMYSGIKKKKNSNYWRGSVAFNNFCIAYYVAKNSSSEITWAHDRSTSSLFTENRKRFEPLVEWSSGERKERFTTY